MDPLTFFTYSGLVKQKIIPDLVKIMSQNDSFLKIKRYPSFVYKNNSQQEYNLQMAMDIQKTLQQKIDTIPWLQREWNSFEILNFPVETDVESVKTSKCFLLIKTVSSFKPIFEASCLEILTRYVQSGFYPNVEYVGFILPLQEEIILCNIKKWKYQKYLDHIEEHLSPDNALSMMLSPQLFHHNKVGTHLAQGENIIETFKEYYSGFPCQMFITNPQSGKRSDNTTKLFINNPATCKIIKDKEIKYFTHSPYVINLCVGDSSFESHPRSTGEPNSRPAGGPNSHKVGIRWPVRILIDDLIGTRKMGGKGVVVHIGAQKDLSLEEALQNMEDNVRESLREATEECPLLLETPCGEGTEICTKIEELLDFYERFTKEEKIKLGICVDTCHVFAAGYDPLDYLQRIHGPDGGEDGSTNGTEGCDSSANGSAGLVKLIHFNDSKGDFGSHVDRHQIPGKGKIGILKMLKIMEWAVQNKVPMVRE